MLSKTSRSVEMNEKHLLVIDDDIELQDLLKQYLEKNQFIVDCL